MGKMLRETRDLRLFPMTGEQYKQFAKLAKSQKLLYSVIRDKDSGKIEVALPVTELERANLIFKKMLYNLPEQQKQEPEVLADEQPKQQIEETEKSEQIAISLQSEPQEDDPKKEYRLASDLNAIRRNSSIWKESGNIIQTTSNTTGRVSVEERLKKFQAKIEATNSLEPTRNKVKNREQAR